MKLNDLIQTNKKLNRRCQRLESIIAKNKYYDYGFHAGLKANEEHNRKYYEKQLAQYKTSVRKELRRLRRQVNEPDKL